jgi:hypothetical protein
MALGESLDVPANFDGLSDYDSDDSNDDEDNRKSKMHYSFAIKSKSKKPKEEKLTFNARETEAFGGLDRKTAY